MDVSATLSSVGSGDVPSSAGEELHAGLLWVMGDSKALRTWKRRWVVLSEGPTLATYKEEPRKLKLSRRLRGTTISQFDAGVQPPRKFALEVWCQVSVIEATDRRNS